MADVKVLLLRTAGTNCDRELAYAFTLAGAEVAAVHINALVADPGQLAGYQILGFPGGFSYGDDIASGKILANQLLHHLQAPLRQFVADGKLILGICNGFQVLVKSGLLPGLMAPPPSDRATDEHRWTQMTKDEISAPSADGARGGGDAERVATLTYNLTGRFEDRWTKCRSYSKLCKWIPAGKTLALPVAHGEGRFVTRSPEVLGALVANDRVVFRYVDEGGEPTQVFPANPNGSMDAIAGICDGTGRVLGLMPHPERITQGVTGPEWTRGGGGGTAGEGMVLFETAVSYVRAGQVTTVN